MTRLPVSISAAGILCVALSAQDAGIQEVTFSVLDRDSKPVADLRPDELQILAGGRNVEVSALSRREQALSIVAVIDMSPSTSIPAEAVIDGVLKEAVASDVIRLARIGGPKILISPALRQRKSEFTDRLRETLDCPADTSPIWDVVAAAIHAVATDPPPRLVVLVTDGRSAGASMSVQDVAQYAVRTETMVSVIDESGRQEVLQWDGQKVLVDTTGTLKALAENTGGMYIPDSAALGAIGRISLPNPYPLVRRAIAGHRLVYSATVRVPPGTTGPLAVRVSRARTTVHIPAVRDASSPSSNVKPGDDVLSRVQDFVRCNKGTGRPLP